MTTENRLSGSSRSSAFQVAGGHPPGTALITGASSGIGAAFARRLAVERYHLILVARREEPLTRLAAQLQHQHRVRTEVLVADLSAPADLSSVEERIAACDTLSMLVNNAGFGTVGSFAEVPIEQHLAMLRVHVEAAVRLSHAALAGMRERGRGAMVNVSSLMAFAASPGSVSYCATKSYLNTFSEALQNELGGSGVQVQALCPGLTHTEFHDHAGLDRDTYPSFLWMKPRDVVSASLHALEKGKVVCIPGWYNHIVVRLLRHRPVWMQFRRMFSRSQ